MLNISDIFGMSDEKFKMLSEIENEVLLRASDDELFQLSLMEENGDPEELEFKYKLLLKYANDFEAKIIRENSNFFKLE